MEEKRTVTSILDSSFMKWVAFIFATIGVVWIFYDNFVKKNCANFEYEILSETSIFNNQEMYLQPIITQYFIDNKSEIWLLFLIAHSKR